MKIKITANYPEQEVRDLLRLSARVVGVKHAGWTVEVKNSRNTGRGACYYWKRHITIGIDRPEKFPTQAWSIRQDLMLSDWREAFVWLAAHELGHALIHMESRKQSETEANWFGWRAVKEYRERPEQVNP